MWFPTEEESTLPHQVFKVNSSVTYILATHTKIQSGTPNPTPFYNVVYNMDSPQKRYDAPLDKTIGQPTRNWTLFVGYIIFLKLSPYQLKRVQVRLSYGKFWNCLKVFVKSLYTREEYHPPGQITIICKPELREQLRCYCSDCPVWVGEFTGFRANKKMVLRWSEQQTIT